MKEFPIFKAEIQDGLRDKIISNLSISSTCDLEICDPFLIKNTLRTTAENKNQVDLHYLKSILVTTGWNKNDDVFDKAEVWIAKSTPSDKPFNYEHDQSQIIGHITGCKVIADDGSDIIEELPIDELPSKFHILTSAVLYKFWEDPKKQEMMNNIIEGIANKQWFVSMEAIFTNFDYAIDDGSSSKVVARNEKTAFLTKHLRAYGGNGIFNNVKIGRVLKNIVFSGKGLVKKPANPESVIFDETEAFVTSSVYNLHETIKSKEIIMSVEEEKIEKQVVEVAEEVAAAIPVPPKEETSEDPALKDAEANKWWEDKKKMEEEASMYEEDKKKMMAESEAMKKQLNMVVNELNNMKKEKTMSDRASLVMEKLGMNKEEAVSVVASLVALNDESFAIAVNMQSEYFNKKMSEYKSGKGSPAETEQVPEEKKKEMEEEDPSSEIEKDPAESKASISVLDTVKIKSDAALATSDGNESVKQVASQIASYFGLESSGTEQ